MLSSTYGTLETANSTLLGNATTAQLTGIETVESYTDGKGITTAASHIAFVDSRLADTDELVASLSNAQVYLIDAEQAGVSYISTILSQYTSAQIESVQIFSHGSAGELQIGATTLNADNLTGFDEELSAWGLSTTGDVLLYGCEVAEGELGKDFIEQLATLTGGDIQASTDLTGSAALGGDWDLEATVGTVESGLAITTAGMLNYEGILTERTITSNGGEKSAVIYIQEGGKRFVTDVQTTSNNEFSEGNGVFYSFNAGADRRLFSINRRTGIVRFREVPDFENPQDANKNNVYFANVLVTDKSGAADSQFLSIVVRDKPESGGSAPTITSGGGRDYRFKRIEEGTSYALDMQASDPDGDTERGGGITYRINAGEDANKFRLDADTGSLFFKERPDFERPDDSDGDNLYRINVLATDSTGKSDSQFIELLVQDRVGDEPLSASVKEGERVVVDLPETDPVGRPIRRHELSGPDADLFEVVDDQLLFKQAPDFDNPADAGANNVYNFTLSAINNKNIAIVQETTVTVERSQASAPPVITSNGGGSNATIRRDENKTFVTNVNATSPNGDSEGNGLVYSLNAGADRNLFNINAQTGVISFKQAPDFENPADANGNNVYLANVLVRDSSGKTDSQFLSIVVEDVAEGGSAPVITNGDFIQVVEGSTLAVDVNATDADGDTEGNGLTYRINAGEDADRFNIDANTGEISFKVKPDFENPGDDDSNNIYRINVLAFDSDGLVDSQFMQIEVTNKVSVYLLGGQSNMAGVGSNSDDLTGAFANPLPDVQIWQRGISSFVDLRPGFRSNFGNADGFGSEIGFGFALEAARDSGDADIEEIYLVKYALGSTDLAEDWDISEVDANGAPNTYSDFNDSVAGALANLATAGMGYTIEGMLWMQGENDAFSAQQAASYQTNLTNFIGDIRTRYGADMDFVIGRLHDELPNGFTEDEVVRSAQTAVADADSRNYLVDTDDFEVSSDRVHFTSTGHLALGAAFAEPFID